MDSKALKFLLKLLSFPNYRAPLSQVKPTPKMKATERNKICQQLRDRQLVACYEEIKTLTISAKGKSLLKIDGAKGSLTSDELKVLQASLSEPISPGKTGLYPESRSPIIENLASRELLAVQKQIKEVWLTERGQKFLVEEYDAANYGNLSFKMLADYLQLIRKYNRQDAVREISVEKLADLDNTPTPKEIDPKITSDSISLDIWQTIRDLDLHLDQVSKIPNKPEDQEILQTIKQLDQELGTDRYLPIFHLREKLQYSFDREELDGALHRLQAQQKIQLKSLEEVLHYSQEYFDAAIDRTNKWSLFFIVLN